MRTIVLLIALASLSLASCNQFAKEKFRVTFANRTAHPIAPLVNGNRPNDGTAVVDSGSARQFTVEVEVLQTSSTGPDMADVTFSAQDLATKKLSREFHRTIQRDRPEYVEINKTDFPY
jgi:hypothetical protein